MNDKEIFKKVGVIISELNSQYNYLSDNPGSLNEFELELLKANGKFLTEHIEILQRLTLSTKAQVATTAQGEQDEEQPPAAGEKERLENNAQSAKEEDTAPSPSVSDDDGEKATAAEPGPIGNEVIIKERTTATDLPPELKESKKEEYVPTVRDQMAATIGAQATVAGAYGKQAITDLKSAISLNDKLLFVKDLFGGYSLAYNEAIELSNRSTGFEAAKNFLEMNYASKNNWEASPATVEKLFELLKRRFAEQPG